MAIKIYKAKGGAEDLFIDAIQHSVKTSNGGTRQVWGLAKYFALLDGSTSFASVTVTNDVIVGNGLTITAGGFTMSAGNASIGAVGSGAINIRGSVTTISSTTLAINSGTVTFAASTVAFTGITSSTLILGSESGGSGNALRTSTAYFGAAVTMAGNVTIGGTLTLNGSGVTVATNFTAVLGTHQIGGTALTLNTTTTTFGGTTVTMTTPAVALGAATFSTSLRWSGMSSSSYQFAANSAEIGTALFTGPVTFNGAVTFGGGATMTLPPFESTGIKIGGSSAANKITWDSINSRLQIDGPLRVTGALTAGGIDYDWTKLNVGQYSSTLSGTGKAFDMSWGGFVTFDPSGAALTFTALSGGTVGDIVTVSNISSNVAYTVTFDKQCFWGPSSNKLTNDVVLGQGDTITFQLQTTGKAVIIAQYNAL